MVGLVGLYKGGEFAANIVVGMLPVVVFRSCTLEEVGFVKYGRSSVLLLKYGRLVC